MHACSFCSLYVCSIFLSMETRVASTLMYVYMMIHESSQRQENEEKKKKKKERESKADQFHPNPEKGGKGRQICQARFEQDRIEKKKSH